MGRGQTHLQHICSGCNESRLDPVAQWHSSYENQTVNAAPTVSSSAAKGVRHQYHEWAGLHAYTDSENTQTAFTIEECKPQQINTIRLNLKKIYKGYYSASSRSQPLLLRVYEGTVR